MRLRIAVRARGAPQTRAPLRRLTLHGPERRALHRAVSRVATRSVRNVARRARPAPAIVADFVPAVVH
ncbi:MAG: hypothetical protein U1F48_18055 [Burkholderiales bacterium]